MKVLYIDHYAGSPSLGMEFRPHQMALQWQKLGVETTILAGSFSHLRKQNPTVSSSFEVQQIDGVDFALLRTPTYQGNGAKRVASMGAFVAQGLRHLNQIIEHCRPDAVITSSTYPFDTWLGQAVARRTGARLVHEIHDLWPLTPMELGGYSPRHPFMAAMALAEKSAYRRSAAVVSILPNTEPHVRSLGISTPVVPVPNGIEATGTKAPADAEITALVEQLHQQGRFVVGYAGGLSVSNAMMDFVRAMNLLRDEPFDAVVIGDGLLRPELEAYLAEHDLSNVHLVGSIAKAAVHETLGSMDALYIGSQRSSLYQFGVSANKIFDYLLTGLPIINAFDTEHSPMTYSGVTLPARAEDAADIARAIREAAELDEQQRAEISRRSIEFVTREHDYPGLAQRFLDVLKGV